VLKKGIGNSLFTSGMMPRPCEYRGRRVDFPCRRTDPPLSLGFRTHSRGLKRKELDEYLD
jgi:hypothetical protein